jgi:hypothetical protein
VEKNLYAHYLLCDISGRFTVSHVSVIVTYKVKEIPLQAWTGPNGLEITYVV